MRGLRVIGWRGLLGSGLGCLLAVFLAGSAQATGFTVANILSLSQNGVSGSILPVSSPGALTCLTGTCDLANQDYLVFQVSLNGGSDTVDWVRASLALNSTDLAQGVGAGNGAAAESGAALNTGTNPQVDFYPLTGTSDLVYITYQPGAFANTATGKISFSVQPTNGLVFSPSIVSFVAIPEPAMGALLLLGASGLALLRRRRS